MYVIMVFKTCLYWGHRSFWESSESLEFFCIPLRNVFSVYPIFIYFFELIFIVCLLWACKKFCVLENTIAYIYRPFLDLLLGPHLSKFVSALLSLQNFCDLLLVIWDFSLNDHLPIEVFCDHSFLLYALPYFSFSSTTYLVFLSIFVFLSASFLPSSSSVISVILLTTLSPWILTWNVSPKKSGTPLEQFLTHSGYWINECGRPSDKSLSHRLHNNLFEINTSL